MRVLLSCYGFSPYRGSEAAVGWNIAKELAAHCDVTVICGDLENKQEVKHDLEKWKQSGETIPNLHFSYVGPTKLIKFIEKIHNLPGCWALYYLAYRLWQKNAYKRAKKLHREKPFDLVHHLTMIGYREPGYMWKLPIPFFWGPVGGSPNEPIAFWSVYSKTARVNVVLRNLLNGIQKRLLVRPRLAARRAAKIWAVTEDDVHTICHIWHQECEKMLETAATPNSDCYIRQYLSGDQLKIVWSGTHTYGKALPILIRSIGKLKDELGHKPNINVDVLGRGVETRKWQKLTRDIGVEECFNWCGYLPHAEALGVMNKAHILAFTSVKEGTPHVVLESLAMGLPVICHNACGMGEAVDGRCGITVPMRSLSESVNGFCDALRKILSGDINLSELSRGAHMRANELTWREKASLIYESYRGAVNDK